MFGARVNRLLPIPTLLSCVSLCQCHSIFSYFVYIIHTNTELNRGKILHSAQQGNTHCFSRIFMNVRYRHIYASRTTNFRNLHRELNCAQQYIQHFQNKTLRHSIYKLQIHVDVEIGNLSKYLCVIPVCGVHGHKILEKQTRPLFNASMKVI